jgi:hypothetical protein
MAELRRILDVDDRHRIGTSAAWTGGINDGARHAGDARQEHRDQQVRKQFLHEVHPFRNED